MDETQGGRQMLVLSRHGGESVIVTVGDVRIEVKILSCLGDRIRLGIDAPREATVNRGEVQDKIDAERVEAVRIANETAAHDEGRI